MKDYLSIKQFDDGMIGTVIPLTYVGTVIPLTYVGTVIPLTYVGTVIPLTYVGTVIPLTYGRGRIMHGRDFIFYERSW